MTATTEQRAGPRTPRGGNGRFSTAIQDRAEASVDGQLGLRAILAAVRRQLDATRAEQARDQQTDRGRVIKYRALAEGIRSGDVNVALAGLVDAAAFEFADEYLEDRARDGKAAAEAHLADNVAALEGILYQLTPALVEGIPDAVAAMLRRSDQAARA